jgi:hypothetical protein
MPIGSGAMVSMIEEGPSRRTYSWLLCRSLRSASSIVKVAPVAAPGFSYR